MDSADFDALEERARQKLSSGAYAFAAGGADDEITLADNVAAWRRLTIVPRMLASTGEPDTSVTVLGRVRPHPLVAAPMAYQRIATADGEIAMARAAAATSTILCISTLSHVSAPDVVAAVPNARSWYQVYVFSDRAITDGLIEAGGGALRAPNLVDELVEHLAFIS